MVSCTQVSIGVDVSEVAGCRHHMEMLQWTIDKLTYILKDVIPSLVLDLGLMAVNLL